MKVPILQRTFLLYDSLYFPVEVCYMNMDLWPAAAAAAAAKSLQSCFTLCDPIDSSPPGSPVPGKSHGQRSLEGYSPWGPIRVRHNLVTQTATTSNH